ncbi:MAG: sulfur carrier protein ThiS [Calditrichaeota bacterium]|nr:sulfur carrier protein ThiS [Calditrichota bacterium]
MKLIVNGENQEYEGELSVESLLSKCEVKRPEMVSVELNGQIIPRDQYADVRVSDGDTVEFLYFMGGGSYGINR